VCLPGDDHGGDELAGAEDNFCGVVDVVQCLEGGREGEKEKKKHERHFDLDSD